MPTENIIESPTVALDTVRTLFAKNATFGYQPLKDQDGKIIGHLIVIYDEGREYAAESMQYGLGTESINTELLGRVLAERNEERRQPECSEQ